MLPTLKTLAVHSAKIYNKTQEETNMKNFLEKHPAFAETSDTILAILSGSFALIAIVLVWIREMIYRKNR